jgi:hypothetical protein
MRNNDSKEPALRFDSYKFLLHRARLATFATQSVNMRRHGSTMARPVYLQQRTYLVSAGMFVECHDRL